MTDDSFVPIGGGRFAFVPPQLPHEYHLPARTVQLIERASRAIGEMNEAASAPLGLVDPKRLFRPLLAKESVLSSKIENIHTSIIDVLLSDSAQHDVDLFSSDEARQVHGYLAAMDYGIADPEGIALGLRYVRNVHEKLMSIGGGQGGPGEFRRVQNFIVDRSSGEERVIYTPPPPDRIMALLNDWEQFVNVPSDLPDLIRCAMAHYQFEVVHPFLDGNGRVGRILLVLMLHKWGVLKYPYLYISEFFERRRTEYYACLLGVSEKGEWAAWLDFFLEGVRVQSEDAAARMREVVALRESCLEIVRENSRSRYAGMAVDFVCTNPVFFRLQLERSLGALLPTAKKIVDEFILLGIVEPTSVVVRNARAFANTGILKILRGQGG